MQLLDSIKVSALTNYQMDESLQHLVMIMIIKDNGSSYIVLKSMSNPVVTPGITFLIELAELSTVDYPPEEI